MKPHDTAIAYLEYNTPYIAAIEPAIIINFNLLRESHQIIKLHSKHSISLENDSETMDICMNLQISYNNIKII